jgi:hypothetical protein
VSAQCLEPPERLYKFQNLNFNFEFDYFAGSIRYIKHLTVVHIRFIRHLTV